MALKDGSAGAVAVRGRGRGRGRGNRNPDGTPNAIDVHVGARVRLRRTLLGMSQERLGKELGLTFQQVQKYERGANRIGASRLYDLCRVLDVPVSFFFDDMPDGMSTEVKPVPMGEMEPPQGPDPMAKRETLELVRAYYKIGDPHLRRRIFELAKALAVSDEVSAERLRSRRLRA